MVKNHRVLTFVFAGLLAVVLGTAVFQGALAQDHSQGNCDRLCVCRGYTVPMLMDEYASMSKPPYCCDDNGYLLMYPSACAEAWDYARPDGVYADVETIYQNFLDDMEGDCSMCLEAESGVIPGNGDTDTDYYPDENVSPGIPIPADVVVPAIAIGSFVILALVGGGAVLIALGRGTKSSPGGAAAPLKYSPVTGKPVPAAQAMAEWDKMRQGWVFRDGQWVPPGPPGGGRTGPSILTRKYLPEYLKGRHQLRQEQQQSQHQQQRQEVIDPRIRQLDMQQRHSQLEYLRTEVAVGAGEFALDIGVSLIMKRLALTPKQLFLAQQLYAAYEIALKNGVRAWNGQPTRVGTDTLVHVITLPVGHLADKFIPGDSLGESIAKNIPPTIAKNLTGLLVGD